MVSKNIKERIHKIYILFHHVSLVLSESIAVRMIEMERVCHSEFMTEPLDVKQTKILVNM